MRDLELELAKGFQDLEEIASRAREAAVPIAWPDLKDDLANKILREIDDFADDQLFTQSDFSIEISDQPDTKFRPILDEFVRLGYVMRNPAGKGKWGYLKDKMPDNTALDR